jgi:hypothetical protein
MLVDDGLLAAGQHLADGIARVLHRVRRRHVEHVQAEQLIRLVAQHVGVLAVDEGDAAASVHLDHAGSGLADDLLEAFAALVQLHLGQLAVGLVDAVREQAGDLAVGIAQGDVGQVDEALLGQHAGLALQHHRHVDARERLAGRVNAVEQVQEALVHHLRQGRAHRLADQVAVADQLQVALVDHLEHVVGTTQHAHEGRRLLEDRIDAFVGRLQRALGLVRGADVARDRQQLRDLPVRAADRRDHDVPPFQNLFGVRVAGDEGSGTALQGRGDGAFDLGMQRRRPQRSPGQALDLESGIDFHRTAAIPVHGQHPALAVEQLDAIGAAVEELPTERRSVEFREGGAIEGHELVTG